MTKYLTTLKTPEITKGNELSTSCENMITYTLNIPVLIKYKRY